MYTGSCLCGEVRFQITGEIKNIIYCHCSKCRKAQGSAFATNGNLEKKYFNIISGENNLTKYEASKGHYKYFCKTCGSPIISISDASPDNVRVRLGTIETDINERPEAHVFFSSRANWENICSDLPEHDDYS
ncbi:Gfa-like protein [hydrothermal vent metagenome]|uniref:Gfa-like protein n=1 Tax=hydrothermal vent metagenome TaxID=652676 RepID=A0A3B0Y697_9ZZZZ